CALKDGKLVASVRLVSSSLDPLFAELKGEGNALKIVSHDGSAVRRRGRGAGRWATAESLLADLSDLAAARLSKAV
ncbi:MAG: homoserine dehydrogenase, partial [Brevundimonas sp.]